MSPLTIWWPVCLHRKFWSLNYLVVPYSCTREAFPCGESLLALYGTCVLWKSFFCLWSFCSGSFGNRLTTKTSFPNFASSLLNRRQWSENLFFAHHIGFCFAEPLSQCLVNKALLKHRRAHRFFWISKSNQDQPNPNMKSLLHFLHPTVLPVTRATNICWNKQWYNETWGLVGFGHIIHEWSCFK